MAFDWSEVSKLLQSMINLNRWKLHSNSNENEKFCPFCEAIQDNRDDFNQWSCDEKLQFATTELFGDITIVPCVLHAKIRVTEKLMKLALAKADDRQCEEQFYEAMTKVQ